MDQVYFADKYWISNDLQICLMHSSLFQTQENNSLWKSSSRNFPNKLIWCLIYRNFHLFSQIPNILLTLVKISSLAKCYHSCLGDFGPSLPCDMLLRAPGAFVLQAPSSAQKTNPTCSNSLRVELLLHQYFSSSRSC